MQIRFVLTLPRDGISVPVVRQVLTRSLAALGVEETVRSDIEVAISEACTNVLCHARDGDEYEVSAEISGDACVLVVRDTGRGFNIEELLDADPDDEGGRGIQLMRAFVDELRFESRPDQGTSVRLEKRLRWATNSPGSRLADSRGGTPDRLG